MPSRIQIAGVYPLHVVHGMLPEPAQECIVLVNTGSEPADMRGWSLTLRKRDQTDHYRYFFPRFLSNGDTWAVEPGGLVMLYTGRGTSGRTATSGEAHQIHLFQHREQVIWQEPGDLACLYDRDGELVFQWALPGVRRWA